MPKNKLGEGVAKLRERLAQKRLKNECDKEECYAQVQLLASEPSGTNQKYKRIGALEDVFIGESPTVLSIKDACLKHFKSKDFKDYKCDLLLTERGPSVRKLTQLDLNK